jgi:3-hydroxybutyrate dehydrogenase
LVTGAASGIGKAVAERLRHDGWQVLGVDLEFEDDAPREWLRADLTTREGNRTAVEEALERFGRLDAIVPNAGFQYVSPIEAFEEDQWDALLALLLTSPFLLAKYAWQALRACGDGRIVVIASVHGLVASQFKAGYVAAKHGVLGLVKTLALEGAPDDISVSAVCPGYVRTQLVQAQIEALSRTHGISADRVLEEVLLSPQAIKELLEPSDVSDAVVWLLSPAGRFATGSPLVLDGGWLAR